MISTVSTKSPLTLFPNLQEQNNCFLWKGFIKKCKKRGHNHRKGSGALYRQLNRSQIKALLEKARDPCLVSGHLPKIDTVLNIFELTKPRLWSKIRNSKQGWEILKILLHSFSFKIPTVPYQELPNEVLQDLNFLNSILWINVILRFFLIRQGNLLNKVPLR